MEYDNTVTFNDLVKMLRFSDEGQCKKMLEQETRVAFRKQIYGRYNRLRNKRERLNILTTCLGSSKHRKYRRVLKNQELNNILKVADLAKCEKLLAEELVEYRRASIAEKIHVMLCKKRSDLERANNYKIISRVIK